jgi:SOS response regulatory protein OraA/RecX
VISNCDPWGDCANGNSNNTIEDNKILNNKIGIFSNSSTSTINRNLVCNNTLYDFSADTWQGSSGSANTCDNPDGWNDIGKTGCTHSCQAAPPTCSGVLQLSLVPNPAGAGGRVTANITGLSYCQGKEIKLVEGTNCSSDSVGQTIIGEEGASGAIEFTAPSSEGNYNYTACIDINDDGDYEDVGEHDTETLTVKECVTQAPLIEASPSPQRNDPGEKAYYEIAVTNKDSCASIFNISVKCTNCGSGWNFTIKPTSSITLDSEKTQKLLLEVSSPSNAQLNTGFNGFNISITVNDTAEDGKTNSTTVQFITRICLREKLLMLITPSEIATAGPKNGSAVLSFENPSSDCTTVFNISTQCPKDWSCTLPTPFWLWAGQSGNLTLSISPKASADAGNYTINISAKVKNIDNYTTNQTSLLFRIVNCTDADKDGFYAEGEPCGPLDCNDQDPDINPNATVYCFSTIDANCDNVTDKNDPKCINRNQSIWENFKNYTVGDGKCESTLGENEANSPSDCKPVQTGKCGDNKRNSGEDCDGTDDSACPGLCTSTCKCPFLVGDGVCDTEAGETAAISPVDCKAKGLPILPLAIIAILAGVGGALAFVFLKRKSALSDIMAARGVESYSPGANPTPAMETALAQGFSPAEVASQFREAGWPEEHVKGALSDIAETQEQLAGLAEQHGVNVPIAERRQAERYVKKCLDMGFTPAQIKTALISADWPEGVVNDILAKYTSEHVRSHAKESGVLKPTEDIEKLRAYVKEELDEGHTPEQIREELLKAGWDEAKINEVLP